jgi:hypothetical protein
VSRRYFSALKEAVPKSAASRRLRCGAEYVTKDLK